MNNLNKQNQLTQDTKGYTLLMCARANTPTQRQQLSSNHLPATGYTHGTTEFVARRAAWPASRGAAPLPGPAAHRASPGRLWSRDLGRRHQWSTSVCAAAAAW